MYIRLGGVRIHIGFPFAAFCAFVANSEIGVSLILVFVSALLHECGHTAALICCGESSLTLILSPFGARINSRVADRLPYKLDAAVAFSGPAVNLSLAAVLYVLYGVTDGQRLLSAAETNLMLGTVNLLPFSFLDGGRILSDILLLHITEERASLVSEVVSASVFVILLILCVYLTVKGENTVFLVAFLVFCILKKHFSDTCNKKQIMLKWKK